MLNNAPIYCTVIRSNKTGSPMTTIDLNSDVPGYFERRTLGDDATVFGSRSSANVACGSLSDAA
jgi:hypothetical protein